MRENQNQHNETFRAERETIRERETATQTVYQIVEIAKGEDPMSINPLGEAHRSLGDAAEELAAFLWEEVGQQQGDRPAEWPSEISLFKAMDFHGHVVYSDLDGQFEWRILSVKIAQ
jgi:hypothetical protein